MIGLEQISVSGTSFLERVLCTESSPPFHCFAALRHNSRFLYVLIFPSFWAKSLRSQTLMLPCGTRSASVKEMHMHLSEIAEWQVPGGDQLRHMAKHLCRPRGWGCTSMPVQSCARARFGETQNYGVVSLRCMCISLTLALLVPHGSERVWDRSDLAKWRKYE